MGTARSEGGGSCRARVRRAESCEKAVGDGALHDAPSDEAATPTRRLAATTRLGSINHHTMIPHC